MYTGHGALKNFMEFVLHAGYGETSIQDTLVSVYLSISYTWKHPRLVADTHTAAESTEVRACSNFLFRRGFLW